MRRVATGDRYGEEPAIAQNPDCANPSTLIVTILCTGGEVIVEMPTRANKHVNLHDNSYKNYGVLVLCRNRNHQDCDRCLAP